MKIVLQDEVWEGEKIKGSRFIGHILHVDTLESVKNKLEEIRLEHPQSSHVCYAWIVKGEGERYSDDGEPRGSAGKPILQHLKGKKLTNVLAVSVRYYGGTKLGVGGLIRAYGNSISSVLERVQLTEYIQYALVQFQYQYDLRSNVQKVCTNHSDICIQIDHQFTEQITTTIQVRMSHVSYIREGLQDACNGRITFVK